jgi:glycine/D-amino acid oxidase-like deaminating enzyme
MPETMFDYAIEATKTLQQADPELARQVQIITPSTNPSLADLQVSNAAGAIKQQCAASLWPYKLVCWVLERLLSSNNTSNGSFNLQTNTTVTSVQPYDGGWLVTTPRGEIKAPKILLCTNAYTSSLLPTLHDIIVPVKGEMSALIPTPNAKLQRSYGFLGHLRQNIEQDDYLVQRPIAEDGSGGELMFGGGRAYATNAGVGISDDSTIDEPAAAYLRKEILKVLDIQGDEPVKELKASHEWTGIMGFSRDSHPWVGCVPEEVAGGNGMYICAGYTGHGMPNAALCAKAAVESMSGKRDEIDLPRSYWITSERLSKAREMLTVKDADEAAIRNP